MDQSEMFVFTGLLLICIMCVAARFAFEKQPAAKINQGHGATFSVASQPRSTIHFLPAPQARLMI
jgi:hypothetical protein